MEELVAKADYITLHIPLNDKTRNTFDEKLFSVTKPGARLLNFARGGLIDDAAVIEALGTGKIAAYVTDFATCDLLAVDGVIAIPHLGASTPESEDNCAVMAVDGMGNFLYNGNILNSVNYPNCDMGICTKAARVAICHKNVADLISKFTSAFGENNINISDMTNKSKGDFAYTMIDCDSADIDSVIAKIEAVDGVFKVRRVK